MFFVFEKFEIFAQTGPDDTDAPRAWRARMRPANADPLPATGPTEMARRSARPPTH